MEKKNKDHPIKSATKPDQNRSRKKIQAKKKKKKKKVLHVSCILPVTPKQFTDYYCCVVDLKKTWVVGWDGVIRVCEGKVRKEEMVFNCEDCK